MESSELFSSDDPVSRALRYRLMLKSMSVSGPEHASYLKSMPAVLDGRKSEYERILSEISGCDLEPGDKESLIREIYRSISLLGGESRGGDKDYLEKHEKGLSLDEGLAIAGASALVSAFLTAILGQYVDSKIDNISRRQAKYIFDEFERKLSEKKI